MRISPYSPNFSKFQQFSFYYCLSMGIHVSEAAIERDGKRAHPLLATNSEHYCDSKEGGGGGEGVEGGGW